MNRVKSARARGLLALAVIALGACTATGRFVSDWGQITLAPGDTGTCHSNPCQVFFEMPPGDGTYVVTGTGFTIGEYPAGKRVNIGSFFESSAIKVKKAGVPNAYIYVPGTSGDVR
jgi:hypothetical protein